jgi:predicted amidophosphoribosyltransferase
MTVSTDRPKEQPDPVCPKCGQRVDETTLACPRCKTPLVGG